MKPRDFDVTFTGAGEREFQAQGRFLLIRESSSDVFVRGDNGAELRRKQGSEIDFGESVQRIMIRSAIAQTVRLTTSPVPQREQQQTVSVNTTTTIDPSNNIAGVAKKTCLAAGSVQLVKANANRVRLIVKVPSDEPDGVWLGGASSSADSGDFIEPGERLILGTTAELWAYGNGVSDVVIAISEEEIL